MNKERQAEIKLLVDSTAQGEWLASDPPNEMWKILLFPSSDLAFILSSPDLVRELLEAVADLQHRLDLQVKDNVTVIAALQDAQTALIKIYLSSEESCRLARKAIN